MENLFLTRPLAVTIGIFLLAPSLYFVASALLNYSFGFPPLWKFIEPIFDNPANKSLGFNINILLLFGPLAAVIINLPQVIQLSFIKREGEAYIYLSVLKYPYSWIIVAVGAGCLATTLFYMLTQHCPH
ncbi:MAG TPA: hypothetical protein VF540_07445 [Segetibacter sp.]